MWKLFFKSIYYKLSFKRRRLLKDVIPYTFLEVDNLIAEYDHYDLAIHFLSSPEEINHSEMASIPFEWHKNQIKLLMNQPEGGTRFLKSHQTRAL